MALIYRSSLFSLSSGVNWTWLSLVKSLVANLFYCLVDRGARYQIMIISIKLIIKLSIRTLLWSPINNGWLVVSDPLNNISQLGWLFSIYGKITNVPNHQPDGPCSGKKHATVRRASSFFGRSLAAGPASLAAGLQQRLGAASIWRTWSVAI